MRITERSRGKEGNIERKWEGEEERERKGERDTTKKFCIKKQLYKDKEGNVYWA